MRALRTIATWLVLLPVFAVVVGLAVANSQSATLHLNPFDAADPLLRLDLPLYQLLFAIFVLGVLAGGIAAWAGRRPRRVAEPEAAPRDWRAGGAAPASTSAAIPVPAAVPASAAAFLPRPERR